MGGTSLPPLYRADYEHAVAVARTVNTHLTSIYGKIGVTSRSAAISYAIKHLLV